MASWITALKLVPWGDVIEATPQVVKAAKNLLRKKETGEGKLAPDLAGAPHPHTALPSSAGEQALQLIESLQAQIQRLEQAQRQSVEIIDTLAQQNAQIVATVGALRTGAQRLAVACTVLGACLVGLALYVWC